MNGNQITNRMIVMRSADGKITFYSCSNQKEDRSTHRHPVQTMYVQICPGGLLGPTFLEHEFSLIIIFSFLQKEDLPPPPLPMKSAYEKNNK